MNTAPATATSRPTELVASSVTVGTTVHHYGPNSIGHVVTRIDEIERHRAGVTFPGYLFTFEPRSTTELSKHSLVWVS